QQRSNGGLEVGAIDRVDLRGDYQGKLGAERGLDGQIRPLLGRDATQKRQVSAVGFRERHVAQRDAVMDRRNPRGLNGGQRCALGVADGDEGNTSAAIAVDGLQVWHV